MCTLTFYLKRYTRMSSSHPKEAVNNKELLLCRSETQGSISLYFLQFAPCRDLHMDPVLLLPPVSPSCSIWILSPKGNCHTWKLDCLSVSCVCRGNFQTLQVTKFSVPHRTNFLDRWTWWRIVCCFFSTGKREENLKENYFSLPRNFQGFKGKILVRTLMRALPKVVTCLELCNRLITTYK